MPDPEIPGPNAYLSATFDDGGFLARAMPGFRARAGQRAFAQAVDAAIRGRTHLLAEAGTGTGKSVGYCVPATYWAHRHQTRVVIATANNALSEQLVAKDLPMLAQALPWPFTFSLLKGRSNYLCAKRRARTELELGKQGSLFGAPDARTEPERQLTVLRQWAADCHDAGPAVESGDRSELPFEPPYELWRRFSIEAGDCTGKKCAWFDRCFANASQARAREASVIVTNYHMLLAHLLLEESSRGTAGLLPPFDLVVGDEAHKLAAIAREMLGFRISAESVRRVAKSVQHDAPGLADDIQRGSTLFFPTMAALRRDHDRYPGRVTGDFTPDEIAAFRQLTEPLDAAVLLLEARAKNDEQNDPPSDQSGEAAILHSRALHLATGLAAFVNPELDDHHVYFLEEDTKGGVVVAGHLVHAGDKLRPWLFERLSAYTAEEFEATDAPAGLEVTRVPVVLTSATLSTGEGSFDFARAELGLRQDEATTLVAASPFDWTAQALFVVPEGLVEPNDRTFREVVVRELRRAILYAGGRTLGLFTSRRMLEYAHSELLPVLRQHGIALFKQGEAPRTKLVEAFKADVTSCLFGTESFWAGVDVPGQACSLVVMDRLPFPSPDDPIAAARAATDPKSFWRYNVPTAILQFKQGFGRLVRSDACKGAVVCLDGRLLSKAYGKQFLRALPAGVPKTTRLDAIAEWLPPLAHTAPEAHDPACFCETCRTRPPGDTPYRLDTADDEIHF